MVIRVSIQLGNSEASENLGKSAQEIAADVLTLCGGDPDKDTCQVQIQDYGAVGESPAPVPVVPPVAPPPPPVPPG